MDVLCSSLFGHHVTSHKNPGEDFVKKVLEAFEAGNKTIIKPVTLCGKKFSKEFESTNSINMPFYKIKRLTYIGLIAFTLLQP